MKLAGVAMIVLALVMGIVPLFTDCHSQGRMLELANGRTVDMKCHWTGRAEMAVAAPLLAIGALMIVNKRKESLRNLSVIGMVLGAFAILLPTALIGVCMSADMLCNAAMRPTLIFTGMLAMTDGLAVFLSTVRGQKLMEIPA